MELIEFLTADILIAFAALVIGILATKAYGSNYLPRKKGKAIEKYMVTDIYPFGVKNDTYNLAQLQLVKSSIKNACKGVKSPIDVVKTSLRDPFRAGPRL